MDDLDAAAVVLPADAWDLSPADPGHRVVGVLTLSAGETDVWAYVDQQFVLDLRNIVASRASDVPSVEGDGYAVSRTNGVLYVAVTDEETGVTIEGSPLDEALFLTTVQTRLRSTPHCRRAVLPDQGSDPAGHRGRDHRRLGNPAARRGVAVGRPGALGWGLAFEHCASGGPV